MNWDVFITCAVTGAGATVGKSPHVPVTPEKIATSAIDAAKAGAAVVHIQVRDPETGVGSRNTALYAEVAERIRDSGTDVVLNFTAGIGGDLMLAGAEQVLPPTRMAPTWWVWGSRTTCISGPATRPQGHQRRARRSGQAGAGRHERACEGPARSARAVEVHEARLTR